MCALVQGGVGGAVVIINWCAPERENRNVSLFRFAGARKRRKTAREQGETFLEKVFRARFHLRARESETIWLARGAFGCV